MCVSQTPLDVSARTDTLMSSGKCFFFFSLFSFLFFSVS